MTLTVTDLLEKLKGVDEVSILEVLNITTEDILERFVDRVEDKYEDLSEEFGETNED